MPWRVRFNDLLGVAVLAAAEVNGMLVRRALPRRTDKREPRAAGAAANGDGCSRPGDTAVKWGANAQRGMDSGAARFDRPIAQAVEARSSASRLRRGLAWVTLQMIQERSQYADASLGS